MIRFFTNYSYGGYEELYLGSFDNTEDFRYHLPLLPVKRAKLASDPSNKKLADEVARLSQCVLIQKNGTTPEATLPEGAFTLISNPGYRTICRRLGNQFVVALSDVDSDDHDEMGGGQRENPFTMLFVFDDGDTYMMDTLLWQLLEKEAQWRSLISHLFAYDPIVNGLRFSLGELRKAIGALQEAPAGNIDHESDVPLIVLENNFKLDYTLEIQKLIGHSLGAVYDASGKLIKGTALQPTGAAQSSAIVKQPKTEGSADINTETQDNNTVQDYLDEQMETELCTVKKIEEHEKGDNEEGKNQQRNTDNASKLLTAEQKTIIGVAIGGVVIGMAIGLLAGYLLK